jgi:hypothetical protein
MTLETPADQERELLRSGTQKGKDQLFVTKLFATDEDCDVRVRPALRARADRADNEAHSQVRLMLSVVRQLVEDVEDPDQSYTADSKLGKNLHQCTLSGGLAGWLASNDKTFVIKALLKFLGTYSRLPDATDLTQSRQTLNERMLGAWHRAISRAGGLAQSSLLLCMMRECANGRSNQA